MRIAEDDHKSRLGQGALDQIKQDDRIFTAAERHVKAVKLFMPPPIIVNALDCRLAEIFHKLKIFRRHFLQVDGRERLTRRQAVFLNKFSRRLFIKRAALDDGNLFPAIKIITRLRPKIRDGILIFVMPTAVKAQNIHFSGVNGARLLRHLHFGIAEQQAARLAVKFILIHNGVLILHALEISCALEIIRSVVLSIRLTR